MGRGAELLARVLDGAMTTRNRGGLYVAPHEQTTVCDCCGKTVREVTWTTETWQTVTGWTRGTFTASLCSECSELAILHCWRCGHLTGRLDDDALCEVCAEVDP
jgi:hypothetical protein